MAKAKKKTSAADDKKKKAARPQTADNPSADGGFSPSEADGSDEFEQSLGQIEAELSVGEDDDLQIGRAHV